MVRKLCIFGNDPDTHLAWFRVILKNANAQAEISNFLKKYGVDIRFRYMVTMKPSNEIKYVIFGKIDKNTDIEKLADGLGDIDTVINVDWGNDISLLSAEFPLELMGERAILLRVTTFIDILKILNENITQSDTLLFLCGLRGGSDAVKYFTKTANLDRDNLITTLSELLLACGWGRLEIDFNFNSLKGKIKVIDCFIADTFGKMESPVCSYISGYFAGFFSEVLGVNMYVFETACKSTGSPYCEHRIVQASYSKIEHLIRGDTT